MTAPRQALGVSALHRALSSVSSAPAAAPRPTFPHPNPEADDFLASLAGPNGLDLVVEMAHDLRSPVTAILFLAEALHQGQSGPVNEAQRRSLTLIYSAALSLCTAASDVIEIARGGRRLVDCDPEPFSISDVLISVRSMILPLALEKHLDVRLVHAIPERRIGHAHALSRVLLNLATNAVKFTDAGTVEIAARPITSTRLELSVSDTGSGIDAKVLRSLYQPFRKRSSDPRHHFSSAGLGLAICRKLVRAMGGDLKVETKRRRGSRFVFVLELPPAPSPE
jgi:signal transduction histidine kinase